MQARGVVARLLPALLSAVAAGGCCSSGSTTGWTFQIHRPPTLASAALVSPTSTLYGLGGQALLPAGGAVLAPTRFAAAAECTQTTSGRPLALQAAAGPAAAMGDPCLNTSLEDLCRRLDRIERRLPSSPGPMPRMMPKGNE